MQVGLMAQEVAALIPAAVGRTPDGWLGLMRRGADRIAQALEGASESSLDAAGRLLLSRDPNALRAALRVQAEAQARRDAIATALARGTANYVGSTARSGR